MKLPVTLFAPLLVLFQLGTAFADTTLITNINGYTLDSSHQLLQFQGLEFTDDRVDRLITADDYQPAPATTVIDGGGATLLPGLIDSHGHVLNFGLALLRVDLVGTASEDEATVRVAEFAAQNPELGWIQGRGWNQVLWPSNSFPTAAMLDAVVSDRPVWLTRIDGHAGWANSAAMELAGVDRNSSDPTGGQIIRDADGNPTGVFIDTAMGYIGSQIPATSREELKLALNLSLSSLADYGLTSVHDAGVDSETLAAYKEMLEAGPLPVRVYAMLSSADPLYRDRLAEGHFASADQTFVLRSVKVYGDGALGSRGAALVEEYSDDPGNHGLLRNDPERLEFLMRAAMNAGFQVNTHAIGDAANQVVLDNYQRLIAETNSRDQRHRIEHAQVLRFEDIPRFAELGVIPAMQATHATSDKNMAEDRLGPVRIQGAYAWRKLIDSGAVIANGSDFPVESANPFFGLYASVTRQDHDGQPEGGWYPEELMTREEAFSSFTLDAAFAGHQEELLGTLEPGKKADFILIDRDFFTVPASEIWQTRVLETWVEGMRQTR